MSLDTICNLIDTLIPDNDCRFNIVKGVDVFKSTRSQERVKVCYEKGVIFIFQGKKEIFYDHDVLTYDRNQYLILPVPTPVECRVIASPDEPVLGMLVELNQKVLNKLIYDFPNLFEHRQESKVGLCTEHLSNRLIDSLDRLLQCVHDAEDIEVLAPLYIKEILYFVLKSPNGYALNSAIHPNDANAKISQMIENIYANYQQKYDINSLSKQVNMSPSSFHNSFKAVTGLPPMQYIKQIKLHKARALLLNSRKTAKAIAYEVGYESLSQFTREYKRMFGATPKSRHMAENNE